MKYKNLSFQKLLLKSSLLRKKKILKETECNQKAFGKGQTSLFNQKMLKNRRKQRLKTTQNLNQQRKERKLKKIA